MKKSSKPETRAPSLASEFAFELRVTVEPPQIVGDSSHGMRRIVPITGGSIDGKRIHGRLLPGSADWQFVRPDGVLELEARYTLQTRDGVLIMVINRGLRHGPAAVMRRLARGEPVAPARYYFRSSAEFEAPTRGRYAWLNRAIFVGVGERAPAEVIIRMYQIN